MLTYLLYVLFILACVVLVVVVLLQPGKADAGALFTSSVSSTAFGPRGTQSILAKITIGAAAGFMLIALVLSLPVINGSHSILESRPVPSPSSQPSPTPTPVPAASPAAPAASPAGSPDTKSAAKGAPAATPEPKKSPAK